MLLRLTMTCVCVAGVILLATMQPVRLEIVRPVLREYVPREPVPRESVRREPRTRTDAIRPASQRETASLNVVDVLAEAVDRMPRAQLAALLALKPDEYVTSLNDRAVDGDMTLEQIFASRHLYEGEYLDLGVSSASRERRVLVLLH